jgi:hypothetical protein
MRRPILLLAMALVAVAATACGGDDDEPEAVTSFVTETIAAEPATSAAAPVTSEATEPPATAAGGADAALAEQAVVLASDLGAGWSGEQDDTEDSGCLTTTLREPGPTAETRGEQLTRGTEQAVRSLAFVYPDPAAAAQAFTLTSDFEAIQCFVDRLKAEPVEGLVVEQVTAEAIEWPAIGDETVAARVTLPVEQGLEGVLYYSDVVMVRTGRVVTVVQLLAGVEPFAQPVAGEALERVAGRVAGA